MIASLIRPWRNIDPIKARLIRFWRNLDPGSEWAIHTIVAMIGLWGVALLFQLYAEDREWLQVVDRGQLFLYSVGFLTSSLYLVQRGSETTTFPHRKGLRSACFAVLILSIVMFSGSTVAATDPNTNAPDGLVAIIGAILLAVSLVIGYTVARADENRAHFDYEAEREKGRQNAKEEYEAALRGQGGSQ